MHLSKLFSKLSLMIRLGRQAALEIENEVEFILPKNLSPDSFKGWHKIEIKQAYPKNKPRARQSTTEDGYQIYEENNKLRLFRNTVCIEQEKHTDGKSFQHAWDSATKNKKLIKDRYELKIGDEKWCVDFFKEKNGNIYFAKAEVEMPTGRQSPKHIPNTIKDNMLFAVPRADRRFSSKKLCHIKHAKEMMQWIRDHSDSTIPSLTQKQAQENILTAA